MPAQLLIIMGLGGGRMLVSAFKLTMRVPSGIGLAKGE